MREVKENERSVRKFEKREKNERMKENLRNYKLIRKEVKENEK